MSACECVPHARACLWSARTCVCVDLTPRLLRHRLRCRTRACPSTAGRLSGASSTSTSQVRAPPAASLPASALPTVPAATAVSSTPQRMPPHVWAWWWGSALLHSHVCALVPTILLPLPSGCCSGVPRCAGAGAARGAAGRAGPRDQRRGAHGGGRGARGGLLPACAACAAGYQATAAAMLASISCVRRSLLLS